MDYFEAIASVGSLATAGALWVSYKMWKQERIRLEAERVRREQDFVMDQAKQIDFWIASDDTTSARQSNGSWLHARHVGVTVSNSSSHAIRDVMLALATPDQVKNGEAAAQLKFGETSVIPPTERGQFFKIPNPISIDLGITQDRVAPTSETIGDGIEINEANSYK